MPEELDLPEADPGNRIAGGTSGQSPAPAAKDDAGSLSIEPEPIPVDDEEPISLVEESDAGEAESGISMVRRRGTGLKKQEVTFKRSMNLPGTGATRCRIFHCRIAVEPLENMQARINEWIDNDKIEVKQVCQELAVLEGKDAKPNLIVIVWY